MQRHRVLAQRIADRDEEGARLEAMRILKMIPETIRRAVMAESAVAMAR